MSTTNETQRESTTSTADDNKSSTTGTTCDGAQRVHRRAKARQHTRNRPVGVPEDTSIEGCDVDDFLSRITDENGNIFDEWWDWKSFDDDGPWSGVDKSGEKRRAPLVDPTEEFSGDESDLPSPEKEPEEFLKAVAPELFADINERFGDLSTLKQETIEYHATRLSEEAVSDDESGFVITTEQEDNHDPWAGVDNETDDDWEPSVTSDIDTEEDTCPYCGSTAVHSYQQQTGSADEGMTGFHKCGNCDESWRSGYGG